MASQISLVVFDLDGTLVASESLAASVIAEIVAEQLGPIMSAEEFGKEFPGRTLDFQMTELARRYGRPLPDTFFPALDLAYSKAINVRLKASDGVEDAIKALLPLPMCVASNGEPATIVQCVEAVGLAQYFNGNYFSARHVDRPKPAPDVFLLAAKSMNVEPERTLVIEDTALGIFAAKSAGMTAIAYAGNHPHKVDELQALEVPVILDFADLPALVLHD
jgi:HAD superfamily hydrolase (TIGR01509 family)